MILESKDVISDLPTTLNATLTAKIQMTETHIGSLEAINTRQAHRKSNTGQNTPDGRYPSAEADEGEEDEPEVSLNTLQSV